MSLGIQHHLSWNADSSTSFLIQIAESSLNPTQDVGISTLQTNHQPQTPPTTDRKQNARYVFGVEATPDTLAIAMVYFVQGVLGLSRLAVNFFFKDELGLDPAEVSDHAYLDERRGSLFLLKLGRQITTVLGLKH
jgi:hypothetical protein